MGKIKETITNEELSKLNLGTVEFAIEQGNKAIDHLIAVGDRIKHKGEFVLLVLVGAFVSILGYMVVNYQTVLFDALLCIMFVYGLSCTGGISYYLWKKVLHQRCVYYSGDAPLYILRDDALKSAFSLKTEDNREFYIKGWQLNELQNKFLNNRKENERLLRGVNDSVKYIFIALVVGLFLFFSLYFLDLSLGLSNLLAQAGKDLQLVSMMVSLYLGN